MKKLAITAVLSAALLAGCAAPPSAAVTATTIATPAAVPTLNATPKPSASVRLSGNYGADLATAGTVPDDTTQFGSFMTKELCESSLSKTALLRSFSSSVKRFGMPGSESSGSSPSVVRLTVAYFCPERATAAEEALKALGYTH